VGFAAGNRYQEQNRMWCCSPRILANR